MAVVTVRKGRLQELAENGRRDARAVLALREHPERFLATVQIGITVVGASAAAFGGYSMADRIAPLFAHVFPEHADEISLVLVVVLVSYLSIVVGELVPKSLALRSAETYSLLVGRILLVLSALARPLVWFLTASSNLVLKPFGDRTTFTESRLSTEELQQLLEEATESGSLHPKAGEIASRALEFPELTAAEVMVPRQQVVMLPRQASPEDLRRMLLEGAHTRMPVYEGQIDNVVGYVNVRDLLALAWEQKQINVDEVMRPGYFIPESKPAVEVLQEMSSMHLPLAIVVDHQGGTAGIITLEDLLEELVGKIFSEHGRHLPELIKRETDGTALVNGLTPIREINRELDLDLPEDGEWTTVAGLCLAFAQKIPSIGEKIRLPGDIVLEIVDASPRRVKAVRLHMPA